MDKFWKKEGKEYVIVKDYIVFYRPFCDKFFKTRYISCRNGYITLKKGFRCDGCSMSPDFDNAIDACLVHDGLYTYLRELQKAAQITREEADKCFKFLMKKKRFKLSWIYFRAVRWFGGLHNARNKRELQR